MRTLQLMPLLLAASLGLAACGNDDPDTTTNTVVVTPPPPEETVTPDPNPDTTPDLKELPSVTPEPGPPAKFRVVITDNGIKPNVESLPEGPRLEATVVNRTDELVPFNFYVTKKAVVGAGQVEGGDQVLVQIRNLLPGELFVDSPPGRKATIEITPKK